MSAVETLRRSWQKTIGLYSGEELGASSKVWDRRALILCGMVLVVGIVRALLFRSVKNDESYYLHEVAVMGDCLRQWQWFGSEAVGMHGFIFKLPAALLDVIFGHSVIGPTIINSVYCAISVYLLYRLSKKILESGVWAILVSCILASNYYFVWTGARFLREPAAVLSVLMFLHFVIAGKNKWLVGLALLLVLDAREYVFFLLFPAYVIWVGLDEYSSREGRSVSSILASGLGRILAALMPPLIYVFLMFFTCVVPANPSLFMLLGQIDGGFYYSLKAVKFYTATTNEVKGSVQLWSMDVTTIPIIREIIGYISKFLFPSSFSFVGTPKIVAIPALLMSFVMAGRWYRQAKINLVIIPLFLWLFLLAYIVRVSNGRYLVPLVPVLAIFWALFLRDGTRRTLFASIVLLCVMLAVPCGFIFDVKSVFQKALINIVMMVFMCSAVMASYFQIKWRDVFITAAAGVLVVACVSINVASSLTTSGQVGQSQLFGINMECRRVAEEFDDQEMIWLSKMQWASLIDVYRFVKGGDPEYGFSIKAWIPKKNMLSRYDEVKTVRSKWNDLAEFKETLEVNGVSKVGLMFSLVPGIEFPQQTTLPALLKVEWLKLERVVELKNKQLYVFAFQQGMQETQ
ncbi:hypothetical protein BVX97_00955 [bacterium E08(2017)]|nr:hypothetical protein BVX97_00955 [bacterium E08(2017)]